MPGSEYLAQALHILSQSFLIPVIGGLLAMFLFVLVETGGFMAEWTKRRRSPERGAWPAHLKASLEEIAGEPSASRRGVMTHRLLDQEEARLGRWLERTDLAARIGPILGLMGTLIPLGPGLAALGAGNVQELAQAVIVAFDTTVVGLAAGGIAFFISKVRRRWYTAYLAELEASLVLTADERGPVLVAKGGQAEDEAQASWPALVHSARRD